MAGKAGVAEAAAREEARIKGRIKALVSGLYDEDMGRRHASAVALGELARRAPGYVRKMWPRIFYAFDDTMSCWGAAEGVGEIGRNLPGLRHKIIHLLKKFQRDRSSCQGYVWAVARIGQVDRESVREFVPGLAACLASDEPCMLGQALWALGELGVSDERERIRGFVGDPRETWIYENQGARLKTVGLIAAEALAKLEGQSQNSG
ncbi:MAG: hypothetical protein Kow0025_11000 [Thermodesulfovibrionales bacterium]